MKISIPFKIYEQIDFFVQKSDIECSGLGKVLITPEGYKVTEITLLKQENTATHTEIDAQAVTKAMYDLRNSEGGIYFWWHSHVNMGVFWSGTDRDTIEEIGQNGLCVAVVFNKKKEMRGAVWLKGSELSPDLYFDDVPTTIIHDGATEETKGLWAKEFEDKCKRFIPALTTQKSGGFTPDELAMLRKYQGTTEEREPFDLTIFEDKVVGEDKIKLESVYKDMIWGYSVTEVDKALAEMLAIVKRAKGVSKHEKKKAYREYKEMAIEQKNYIAEKMQELEHTNMNAWEQKYGC